MPEQVNTKDGGRGMYRLDPDGHVLDPHRALRWLAGAGRVVAPPRPSRCGPADGEG
jgi:hypothetical protein